MVSEQFQAPNRYSREHSKQKPLSHGVHGKWGQARAQINKMIKVVRSIVKAISRGKCPHLQNGATILASLGVVVTALLIGSLQGVWSFVIISLPFYDQNKEGRWLPHARCKG